MTRSKCVVAFDSTCTLMMSAPALAKSATRCSGSTIICARSVPLDCRPLCQHSQAAAKRHSTGPR